MPSRLASHSFDDSLQACGEVALLLSRITMMNAPDGQQVSITEVATILAAHGRRMVEAAGSETDGAADVETTTQLLIYRLFIAWLDADDLQGFELGNLASTCRQEVRSELNEACRGLRQIDRITVRQEVEDYGVDYFYEPFLAAFDPATRAKLGVWYTPREVAAYQVRRVHHHLQVDLDLPQGLADERVVVIDPAAGSGTYLLEVMRFLFDLYRGRGVAPDEAAQRVKRAAGTRLTGFEVVDAARQICVMQIRRLLASMGAETTEESTLPIHLASYPAAGQAKLNTFLGDDSTDSVLAIVGNPPYEGYSTAKTEAEKALVQDWIDGLWEEYGVRKHRLNNLYVRFWRMAVQNVEERGRRGVISLITDRKWLGGRSFPTMRRHIVEAFDEVVIDDLHGSAHDRDGDDENIFATAAAPGIKQGVAIVTAVRKGDDSGARNEPARIRRRDLRGGAAAKRAQLARFTRSIDSGLLVQPATRQTRWRFVADPTGDFPGLADYFQDFVSAVQPVREAAVMAAERAELRARMMTYFDDSLSHDECFEEFPAFAMKRARYHPKKTRSALLKNSRFIDGRLVPFLFKPFDGQWLYWEPDHKLLNEARRQLMDYYLRDDDGVIEPVDGQWAIVAAQTPRRPSGPRPTVTTGVPAFECVDPNARVLPRLRPDGPEMLSTIDARWIDAVRGVGIGGSDEELADIVFFGLVAVMYSPLWLDEFGTDNDDFAGVPLPADPRILKRAGEVGRRIAELVDPFSEVDDLGRSDMAVADKSDRPVVTAGSRYSGGRFDSDRQMVLWNEEHGWRGVPEEVWEYRVGGFPVLSKWLSYRHTSRGVAGLSDDDVVWFGRMCRRIAAVIELSETCDEIYAAAIDEMLRC